jgi:hypothetical protein
MLGTIRAVIETFLVIVLIGAMLITGAILSFFLGIGGIFFIIFLLIADYRAFVKSNKKEAQKPK